jgi:hypothetical protein
MMVAVSLIVEADTGVNDMLDRDGSRTPVGFRIANDQGKNPVAAEVVQAATNSGNRRKTLALRGRLHHERIKGVKGFRSNGVSIEPLNHRTRGPSSYRLQPLAVF